MRPYCLVRSIKIVFSTANPLFFRHIPSPKQNIRTFYNTPVLKMATASKIKLDPSFRPAFAVKDLKQEAADKASELLQENHEKHHIFFNQEGFHVR